MYQPNILMTYYYSTIINMKYEYVMRYFRRDEIIYMTTSYLWGHSRNDIHTVVRSTRIPIVFMYRV